MQPDIALPPDLEFELDIELPLDVQFEPAMEFVLDMELLFDIELPLDMLPVFDIDEPFCAGWSPAWAALASAIAPTMAKAAAVNFNAFMLVSLKVLNRYAP